MERVERQFDSFEATPDLPREVNLLSEAIIGAAIEVHRALGPGLLERIYEEAMVHELTLRGIRFEQQLPTALEYKGKVLVGQRIDLVVERTIVVELKAEETVPDIHLAQLLGYVKAGGYPLGLLINFNVPVLWRGVYRRAATAPKSKPSRLHSASSA
jgi:GxxExxY protein